MLKRTRTRLICATGSAVRLNQKVIYVCVSVQYPPCHFSSSAPSPPPSSACPLPAGQGVVQQASVTRFARFMFANLCDTAATGDAGQTIAKVRPTDMAKEMEPVAGVLYSTLLWRPPSPFLICRPPPYCSCCCHLNFASFRFFTSLARKSFSFCSIRFLLLLLLQKNNLSNNNNNENNMNNYNQTTRGQTTKVDTPDNKQKKDNRNLFKNSIW